MVRRPDDMDVDNVNSVKCGQMDEEVRALGERWIYRHRCCRQGHVAVKCATHDTGNGKGNGGKRPKGHVKGMEGKGTGDGRAGTRRVARVLQQLRLKEPQDKRLLDRTQGRDAVSTLEGDEPLEDQPFDCDVWRLSSNPCGC